jgi:hypothetical protein
MKHVPGKDQKLGVFRQNAVEQADRRQIGRLEEQLAKSLRDIDQPM